jgi:hypothetical protein
MLRMSATSFRAVRNTLPRGISYTRRQPSVLTSTILSAWAGAEHPDRKLAERHHTSPRERRNVDQGRRLVAHCIGEAVSQDEPAFRIRVLHFDGLSRQRLHDIARLHRPATRHVFRHRQDTDES